jgi:hypothetical protein
MLHGISWSVSRSVNYTTPVSSVPPKKKIILNYRYVNVSKAYWLRDVPTV